MIRWMIALLAVSSAVAGAMPFRPGLFDQNGYSKELGRYLEYKKEPGLDEPEPVGKLAPGDTVRAIVILIDFTDAYADTVNHPGWRYQQMLFDGPWPSGTMKEYYHEISYGDFTVIGEVTAIWYRANNGHDYYGYANGSARAAALVREACVKADPDINFSLYDRDGNGYVDALFVIHQGPGREETGNNYDIHSHKWYLSSAVGVGAYTTGEGKICDAYSIEPERHNSTTYSNIFNRIITIGVFAHEYGHIIGLPDLYDTDYSSDGLGNYCLMSGGSWGGNNSSPSRPVHMCAWSKAQKGWLVPENIPANVAGKKLPPVETSRSVYKIWKNGSPGQQYFLVENRRKQGFDALLPNNGLLVYHIDASQSGNSNDNRRLVDLESAQADTANKDHLDVQGGSGADGNDYWPGWLGKAAFDPFSDADSRSYTAPYLTMAAAYNIAQDNGDTVRMDVFVGGSNLAEVSSQINDASGNNNGIAEEGETVGLTVTLANTSGWSNATGVSAVLSTTDTSVTITKAAATFPNIDNGSSGSCAADSFAFYVKPGAFPHKASFILTKTCSQGSYDRIDTVTITIGSPRVLLVDDDNGAAYEQYYQAALDSNAILCRTWSVAGLGSPPLDTLTGYPIVIWFTGNDSLATLTDGDTTNLKAYLDGGGKLFLSSKQLGQQLGSTGFYANYLRAIYVANSAGQNFVRGVPGNPIVVNIGDTLALGGSGGANNATSLDKLTAVNGGDSAFVYRTTGGTAAITFAGAYKLVYFGFPFEAMGGIPSRHKQRAEIMRRIMAWFGGVMPTGVSGDPWPGRPSLPSLMLSQNAPNPFSAATAIRFQLGQPARTRLALYNALGQRVKVLAEGLLAAGVHTFCWDGADQAGRRLSSGVYFFRLETVGQGTAVRKAMLLR
ncbi:MAG: M6 family metalloprotease domain-containing protein [Candidatus Edwardsbacteria bacterium]|nr:M6 family metalloprotease domain-containing protein [Candidatus Edwardsbacteria bacterium]